MKSKILVYIPHDFTNPNRGSSMRPYYLVRELKKVAEVNLITGSIKDKKRQIKEFKKKWGMDQIVDMAYVESMNHPFRFFEILFFIWLRFKRVSMGIFIRDIHWFFPRYFLNKNLRQRVKRYRQIFQYFILPKVFTISFSPSREFFQYFQKMGFKKIVLLPPGGLLLRSVHPNPESKTIIYVGGVGGDRGEDLLVRAYNLLKNKHPDLKLKIIGNEQPECLNKYKKIQGIEIYTNLSSNDLDVHYRDSAVATIPLLKNPFYEIARTIKVYEYMSYGLPVVTTPRKETASVVDEEDVGEVSGDTPEEFADSLERVIYDRDLYKRYSQNGLNSVKSRNSWGHRANKIIEVLSGIF